MPNLLENYRAEGIVAVIAIMVLVAWLVGYASGRIHVRKWKADGAGQTKITDACLAVLGLLLAFSFGSAYSKYEMRREAVVSEANAIGTFSVRVGLLPEAVRPAIHKDLKEYVRLHLELGEAGFAAEGRQELDKQMLALQVDIRDTVLKTLQSPEMRPLATPLMASLNDMLDQYEIRYATKLAFVPASVVFLLMAVSVISSLMLGRSQGVQLTRPLWVSMLFLVLVVLVIYITMDLDQSWHGLSRTSQLPMERLAQSME